MLKDIDKPNGNRLGSLKINYAGKSNQGVPLKKIDCSVNGESSVKVLPRYSTADNIDLFGLPPFNEWAIGKENIENTSKEFSDGQIEEEFRSKTFLPSTAEIKLKRKINSLKETYSLIETGIPERKAVAVLFDIKSSNGDCRITMEKDINSSRAEINKLRDRLNKTENKYLTSVRREERKPDLVLLKTMRINGEAPAAKMEMYPFWEKTSYDNELIRCLEIGYLDYGDNETKLDQNNGKWFKLMSFEDFDHPQLEIREGNWKSKKIQQDGRKIRTLKNYEKYLYSYKK